MEPIDEHNSSVLCGCCCAYTLVSLHRDSCTSCTGSHELLCCTSQYCCRSDLEPLTCAKEYDQICMLGCYICGFALQIPKTCVKSSHHCVCCVQRVVFPCDETMPCIVNVCCLNLYPKVGCVVMYGEVENTGVCKWCAPSFKVAAAG